MTDHEVLHGGYLVPTRRDLDGTILIICFIDSEMGVLADGWSLYCPACRTAVSPILAGTEGVQDLDGLDDGLVDAFLREEMRLASAHAAAMTAQPEPVELRTAVASPR